MTPRGAPSIILDGLYRELDWAFSSNDLEVIRFPEFEKITMDTLELFGSSRTCKEKWKQLIDFGYFTKVNQYACTADLHAIRKKLGIEESGGTPNE